MRVGSRANDADWNQKFNGDIAEIGYFIDKVWITDTEENRRKVWGRRDEAEACFRRAVEISRRQLAKSLELRAATSLAHLQRRQGKVAEARELLSQALASFDEGSDTPDLREAAGLLSLL